MELKKMENVRISRIVQSLYLHLILILGVLITILPFVWMISTSFKPKGGIFSLPPQWFPKEPTLEWYRQLIEDIDFMLHFKNSLIVTVSVTFLNLFLSSLAGYAFAKLKFAGRDKIFTMFMAMLMVPGQVSMIPVFLLLKQMGLLNNYLGVIIPAAVGVFGIFLMRQFIMTIPDDLIEAARIDGCSEFRIYWDIVLPLCKPVLATLGILTFMGSWNDFLWPLIVMVGEEKYTLTVALANLNGGPYSTAWGLMMAASVIVILPVLAVFIFSQKYVIQGIATTGLKQ